MFSLKKIKSYTSLILGIIVIHLFFACKSRDLSENTQKIVIIDSIDIIPENKSWVGVNFDLWKKNKSLLLTSSDYQVYLIDSSRTIPIGSNGDGPNQYLRVAGVYATSKDSIFISDFYSGKVFVFNSEGNILNTYNPIAYDTLNRFGLGISYLNAYKNENNELIIEYYGEADKYTLGATEYYFKVAKNLSVFNTVTKKVSHFIPFEEKSPYRTQRLVGPTIPVITKLKSSKQYTIVYPHEDKVFMYDSKNIVLSNIIESNSSFFPNKIKGVPFGTRVGPKEVLKYNKLVNANNLCYDSSPNFIDSNGDVIFFKQYIAPAGEDKPNNPNVYLIEEEGKEKRFLQIFNLSKGSKISDDILIPKNLAALMYAQDFNYLVFVANSSITDNQKLYVCKIISESSK